MDKVIFITGAASGIGRETALLFNRRGWKVGLVDVNEKGLAEVHSELEDESRAWTATLDVRDSAAYRETMERFATWSEGRLNALFNCAGIMRMGPFGETPIEEHIKTVEINIIGVMNGVHAALPHLRNTKGAHVISMGSASGIYGVPDLASYSASKFFIRGLTEALNIELEKDGIVVTDLMPLYVDSPMIRSQSYQAGSLTTFGAKLTPRQIARLVWTAAHGDRVHWVPGQILKTLNYLGSALPWISRPTMKLIDKRRRA